MAIRQTWFSRETLAMYMGMTFRTCHLSSSIKIRSDWLSRFTPDIWHLQTRLSIFSLDTSRVYLAWMKVQL